MITWTISVIDVVFSFQETATLEEQSFKRKLI